MERKIKPQTPEELMCLEECKQFIRDFIREQTGFKKAQENFEEFKANFNEKMQKYFADNNIGSKLCFEGADETITVTKVQGSSVTFDADKLEKALGKKRSKDVVLKRYEISDMDALIAYLKECGADPKIFKSFILVTKYVDTKELDRLEEIGKITTKDVQDCYTVKKAKPYFKATVRKE